jgi:glutaredoxin 3
MATMFLKKNRIKYTEINVELDLKAARYVINKTKQRGIPVIEIGNTMIVGYDEKEMKKALGI